MQDLKDALEDAVPLGNVDYGCDNLVVLVVDTSFKAVGYYIYQEGQSSKIKKVFVKFGLITLNNREARFSQPKRVLFGPKRALEVNEYFLIGCRKLIVETDAKYLSGMLNPQEMGPNVTINCWIEEEVQPGDKEYTLDEDSGETNPIPKIVLMEGIPPPLEFDDFKEQIDSRGGYLWTLATSVNCFRNELDRAKQDYTNEEAMINQFIDKTVTNKGGNPKLGSQLVNQFIIPTTEMEVGIYTEGHRTRSGKLQDDQLPVLRN